MLCFLFLSGQIQGIYSIGVSAVSLSTGSQSTCLTLETVAGKIFNCSLAKHYNQPILWQKLGLCEDNLLKCKVSVSAGKTRGFKPVGNWVVGAG